MTPVVEAKCQLTGSIVEADPHLVACDVRPQCEHVGRKVTRAILTNVEQREVERRFGLVLDLVMRDIGAHSQDDIGDGVRAVDLAGQAGMGFDDRRLASRARQHDGSWVRHKRRAVGLREEHQLDRSLNDRIGRERDERAVVAESRVQRGEGMVKGRECVRENRLEALTPFGEHRWEVGHDRTGGQLLDAGELGHKAAIEQAMAEAISVLPRMDDRLDRMEGRLDYIEADVAEIKVYVAGHHEAIIELKAASNTH
jgi:hypothetical protein